MSGAHQAEAAAGGTEASSRSVREGALEVSLTDGAYSYNDVQFTLELSHMEGDECIENDADASGLPISASQAEIDAYLEAAMRCAKAKVGTEIAVRNVSGYAAAEGVKAVAEVKARVSTMGPCERASMFFTELLDSCESLQGIAEQFGQRTLVDLMYLQNAILTSGQIEVWPDETRVCEALKALPSSGLWLTHTKLAGVWAESCDRVPA